jgi:glycosyltransferase involved in cell wall biosynthesis
VPYKLPSLPIDCFARSAKLREHQLLIVGDGPEREEMERKIAQFQLGGSVQLLGKRTQAEVGELMRRSDVFVFPSIRELGAGVVAEAMASGLCCVATDYGGPAELLASGRGVKVPLAGSAALTASFTRALEDLTAAPERLRRIAEHGRQYAMSHLTWDVKARFTIEIYRWVTGQRGRPPAPYAPDWTEADAAHAA